MEEHGSLDVWCLKQEASLELMATTCMAFALLRICMEITSNIIIIHVSQDITGTMSNV